MQIFQFTYDFALEHWISTKEGTLIGDISDTEVKVAIELDCMELKVKLKKLKCTKNE